MLNRTTLGYEVRAVGFNPDAAAYGGINVKKNIIRAMAISGAFAGLAGAVDMLGYLYHTTQLDLPISQVGFLGIAVALLGRNSAVGVFFSALLFGGLLFGTTHGLQGVVNPVVTPELAGQLTYLIVGLVVLFVSAALLITLHLERRARSFARRPPRASPRARRRPQREHLGGELQQPLRARASRRRHDRLCRNRPRRVRGVPRDPANRGAVVRSGRYSSGCSRRSSASGRSRGVGAGSAGAR